MSEWRPEEGWVNLYRIAYESHKDTLPSLAVQFGMQGLAYEDGADAMLAALKADGNAEYCVAHDWIETVAENENGEMVDGTWVFIPDKE